ncbi:inhibitor of growth protein 1 isoform X1 [Halyomorpha halys]|uniref:inhibitor of growth protein 1 isoform X1 n=2 Tax=Halyomorpha halys TaxID=286706 RepID=UPI0006D527DE|nr:inhibitor of growth protein 1 [Halyomorpha halys]
MLNQNTVDALRSASYLENYFDCVENLPDDIQRYLSRLHELDVTYRSFMKDAENFKGTLQREDLEVNVQRKTLLKLEQILIALQEVGDEKVEIGQLILDLIDNKYRALDQDLRELGAVDLHKEEENAESGTGSTGKESSRSEPVNAAPNAAANERSKRSRRNRGEDSSGPGLPPENESHKKRQSGSAATKKKKRKSRSSNNARDDSPPREEDIINAVQADIDEPTYCLCDQISYGEMILCDNDLCPIEWFHFVCVSLTTKPKGKWFCPKCRGDRPNVMKPKSQFLKELERYNKEKEEKS